MSIENKVPMSDFTEVTDISDNARIIGLQDNENVKIPLQSLIAKTLSRVDEDVLKFDDINVEGGVTGFNPIGEVKNNDSRAVSGSEVNLSINNVFKYSRLLGTNHLQWKKGIVDIVIKTKDTSNDYVISGLWVSRSENVVQLFNKKNSGYMNLPSDWVLNSSTGFYEAKGYLTNGDYVEVVIDKNIITTDRTGGVLSFTDISTDRYVYTVDNENAFFEINRSLPQNLINVVNAFKTLKVYTVNTNRTYNFFSVSKTGNRFALQVKDVITNSVVKTLYITVNNFVMLDENLMFCRMVGNGETLIEFTFDWSHIEENNVNFSGIQLKILPSLIEKRKDIVSPITYASLGSSISTYAWHIRAIQNRLGYLYKPFGVGGATFLTKPTAQLNYGSVAGTADNCIMNQVARLYKDYDDNGYLPNVITIMSGLNDSEVAGMPNLGTPEQALAMDMSSLTPTNWFDNATTEQKTTCGSLRATLYFLNLKFPNAQIIVYTPAQNSYPYNQVKACVDAQKAICERLGIPIVDFFNESGWSSLQPSLTYYTSDGTHPNALGQDMFTDFIIRKLSTVLYK